jgi:hypothetical protein
MPKKEGKKLCNFPYQKSIAKLAFAIGQRQPIRNYDDWEQVLRIFVHYLQINQKIVQKYVKMGNSTERTHCKNNGNWIYENGIFYKLTNDNQPTTEIETK